LGFAALFNSIADACTRVVYFGKEGQVITDRSVDWAVDMLSELWIFPRGMARDGGLREGATSP
jgi:choloylglycine hydrolase